MPEVSLTRIRTRFRWLHGVGVSCVNALSTHLKATVHRNGKVHEQEYSRGIPQYDVREDWNNKQNRNGSYL